MRDRRLLTVLAGVLAAALLTGCGGGGNDGPGISGVSTPGNHGFHGTYLADDPFEVPPILLEDTSGKRLALSKPATPVQVIFFGYTHCPDICQIMMSTIAGAMVRLDDDQRARVQVAFVTTDPARDTGPVLREYLDRFDPTFIGLTGTLRSISAMAKPLNVYLEKGTMLPSGGYEVDHSTYVYGVTGADVRVIWNQGTSPADMAADIIKLLKQKESA